MNSNYQTSEQEVLLWAKVILLHWQNEFYLSEHCRGA